MCCWLLCGSKSRVYSRLEVGESQQLPGIRIAWVYVRVLLAPNTIPTLKNINLMQGECTVYYFIGVIQEYLVLLELYAIRDRLIDWCVQFIIYCHLKTLKWCRTRSKVEVVSQQINDGCQCILVNKKQGAIYRNCILYGDHISWKTLFYKHVFVYMLVIKTLEKCPCFWIVLLINRLCLNIKQTYRNNYTIDSLHSKVITFFVGLIRSRDVL